MNIININKNKRNATLVVVVVVFAFWLFLSSSSSSSSSPSNLQFSHNEQTLEPTSWTPSSSSYHLAHTKQLYNNNDNNNNNNNNGNSNKAPFCILPVGDSLTQGVEMYTGYRAFLKKEIRRTFEKKKNVHFVGSKVGTCVLGKPTNIFDPLRISSSFSSKIKRDTAFESKVLKRIRENEHDEQKFFFEELHEGHCSWGARLLRERLDQVVIIKDTDDKRRQAKSNLKSHQPLIRGPQSSFLASKFHDHPCRVLKKSAVKDHHLESDDEDDASLLFRYDIALLMIGHNNVFQIASFCKMKEGRRLTTEALEFLLTIKKKGNKRTSQHHHSRGNNLSFDDNNDDDDDTQQEEFFKLLNQKEKCAYSVLKSDFVPHIEAMISKLLGVVVISDDDFKNNDNNNVHQDQLAPSSSFPKLIIGLNPPTGFPNINILLHHVMKETVRKYSTKQLLSVRERISLASFPQFGFGKEKHTFDSTHPNEEGAKILAQGWSEAIRKVL